ncbi:hypothetical protein BGZ96_001181 [Linnemannia gamsii]|uniref:Uncharacterized protein n=1 Tax=Linnemannia gamsii TaxID=64522 RepID=A0ABQ7JMS7_9FUNG|nr:hypothetical protein BGZ96_001181 [Linnemannia gamsii]
MDATFILGPDGRSLDFDYQRQAEEVQMTPGGFLYGGHATFRSTSIKGAHRAVFDEDPTKLFNIGTHIKLNNLSKNSGQSRSFIVDLYLFDRPTKKDGNEDVESDDSEDGDERTRNKLKSVFGGFGSYLAQGPIENYESDDGDNSDNDGDDESDEDYDQSDEDYDQSDEDYDQSDEDYNKSDEDYDDNDQDSSNPQDDKEESGRKTKGKDKKREEDESGRKTRGREKKREEEESRRTTKGKEKKWEEEEEEEEEQQKKQAKKTKRSRDTNDGDDEKPSSSASTSRNVNKKTRR